MHDLVGLDHSKWPLW